MDPPAPPNSPEPHGRLALPFQTSAVITTSDVTFDMTAMGQSSLTTFNTNPIRRFAWISLCLTSGRAISPASATIGVSDAVECQIGVVDERSGSPVTSAGSREALLSPLVSITRGTFLLAIWHVRMATSHSVDRDDRLAHSSQAA